MYITLKIEIDTQMILVAKIIPNSNKKHQKKLKKKSFSDGGGGLNHLHVLTVERRDHSDINIF